MLRSSVYAPQYSQNTSSPFPSSASRCTMMPTLLMPNLPTSQTPHNNPAELHNSIDEPFDDGCHAVDDCHDAVTDGAEGAYELVLC